MMRMANRLIGEGMRTTISDLEKDWHEDMIGGVPVVLVHHIPMMDI